VSVAHSPPSSRRDAACGTPNVERDPQHARATTSYLASRHWHSKRLGATAYLLYLT